MGFYEWALKMRKKPIEERRRFTATATIAIMAVITALWFVFFFTTLPERLKNTDSADSTQVTASVADGIGRPAVPFPGNK